MSLIFPDQSTPESASVYLLHPKEITASLPLPPPPCFEELCRGFAKQSRTAHTLTDDLESASLILAPISGDGYGVCFERLRRSSFYRAYAGKLVAYSLEDNQFPGVRGLYPSAGRDAVRRGWALPAHYISSRIHKFAFTPAETQDKDILFSFVGASRTHRVREEIVRWRQRDAVIVDSSPKNDREYWWEKTNKDQFLELFRDVARRSQFVLCPRGVSPSSIRLFEAMEASAVPVIIADDLELPIGPDWNEFSLRVLEEDVCEIPRLLEKLQPQAAEMGAAARRAWEDFFSPAATIGSVVNWAQRLLDRRTASRVGVRLREYLTPNLLRGKLRHALQRVG